MELWNDFEGKTVDGRFQLVSLIGPKGRSAYFAAKDETGAPVMVRLIESLNDEDEILARWRLVTGMKQEHLVAVLASGQTVLEGTHLVYAVMEPTDMELADVLREGALPVEETRQIGLSVADGLGALHARGLVHEHVEADNVLARGETVKLRADVVREAPEGEEGTRLRRQDVRQLGQLLVHSLTGSRRGSGGGLPAPFEEVVRKAESGAWGLAEVVTALRPAGMPRVAASLAAEAAKVGSAAGTGAMHGGSGPGMSVRPGAVAAAIAAAGNGGGAVNGAQARKAVVPAAALPVARTVAAGAGRGADVAAAEEVAEFAPAAVASRLAKQSSGGATGGGAGASAHVGAHVRGPRVPDRIVMEPEAEPRRWGLLAAVVAGLLVLVVLGIHFYRAGREGQKGMVVQDAVTAPDQSSASRPPVRDTANAPVPMPRAEKPSAAMGSPGHARAAAGAAVTGAAPGSESQWRVVAFTYNREDQAEAKVRAIAGQHPGLKPEVYSPSGRSPYLVTLGGWMTVERASAFKQRARAEGMPRDVYTQNYRGKGGR